jgi:hypothetical protein
MTTMSTPYGGYMDRQSNPVANVGGVWAAATYDLGAKVAIQYENANSSAKSAYGGAEDESVWNIVPDNLLFSVPGQHGSNAGTELSVLPTIAGLATEAAALYPGDDEMQRACVKNKIQYQGAAYQALSATREDANRGISVQMAGLKTLRMGVGDGPDFIKPGDLVCAEVPLPNRSYTFSRNDSVRSAIASGEPPHKATLQLRRCTGKSSGATLRMHIQKLLADPTSWKIAMGERLIGTAMWATAAHEVMVSYLTAVVLGVTALVETDMLRPSDLSRFIPDETDDFLAANLILADDNQAGFAKAAIEVSCALAKLLGLVDDPDNELGKLGTVTEPDIAIAGLRDRILQKIFYDGSHKNMAAEFGHFIEDRVFRHRGRHDGSPVVNMGTCEGKLLHMQLNHIPRAVGGFHAAILDDLRFIVGKATTGASLSGSAKAHVLLGVARQ